jgi:hypothetical protein
MLLSLSAGNLYLEASKQRNAVADLSDTRLKRLGRRIDVTAHNVSGLRRHIVAQILRLHQLRIVHSDELQGIAMDLQQPGFDVIEITVDLNCAVLLLYRDESCVDYGHSRLPG